MGEDIRVSFGGTEVDPSVHDGDFDLETQKKRESAASASAAKMLIYQKAKASACSICNLLCAAGHLAIHAMKTSVSAVNARLRRFLIVKNMQNAPIKQRAATACSRQKILKTRAAAMIEMTSRKLRSINRFYPYALI